MNKFLILFFFISLNIFAGNTPVRKLSNDLLKTETGLSIAGSSFVTVNDSEFTYRLANNHLHAFGYFDLTLGAVATQSTFTINLPAVIAAQINNFSSESNCSGFAFKDHNSYTNVEYSLGITAVNGFKRITFLGKENNIDNGANIRILYSLDCMISPI
jgi:hypothetical protein